MNPKGTSILLVMHFLILLLLLQEKGKKIYRQTDLRETDMKVVEMKRWERRLKWTFFVFHFHSHLSLLKIFLCLLLHILFFQSRCWRRQEKERERCRHLREQRRVLPSPEVPFIGSPLILNWSRVCTSWSRGWKVSRKIEKRSLELIVTVIRSLLFSPCKTCLPPNFLWLPKPSKCLTGKKMRLPRNCTFFTDSFLGSEFLREELAREN